MEDWCLEHLLSKLEGDSGSIHIVDDNIDSSLRSLPEAATYTNKPLPIFRRSNSLNNIIVVDGNNNDCQVSDFYYADYSPSTETNHQQLPTHEEFETDNNENQLSARMERHRMSRWDASPVPSSESAYPNCRTSFQSTSTATTTSLHHSFDSLTLDTSEDFDVDDNDDPPRNRDDTKKTTNTSKGTYDCDYKSRDRRSLAKSMGSAHRYLINKAIAISTGDRMRDIRRGSRSTRKKNTIASGRFDVDPTSSLGSMNNPPSVPKRRCSIDDIEIPTASLEGLLAPGMRKDVPGCLRDLPYFNCKTHTR